MTMRITSWEGTSDVRRVAASSNKSLDSETQQQDAASPPRVLCSGQRQRWAAAGCRSTIYLCKSLLQLLWPGN